MYMLEYLQGISRIHIDLWHTIEALLITRCGLENIASGSFKLISHQARRHTTIVLRFYNGVY